MAENKQPVTEVKAFARYIHVSPRKLRLVADLVRQQSVATALEQLRFFSKNAALPLAKAINSAVANAVHNFNLNKDDLFVKAITIDGGPVYKGYAPRAQGRAFVVRKRTSHINVVLESRTGGKKKTRSIFSIRPKAESEVRKTNQPEAGEVNENKHAPKQAGKPEEKMKQQKISLKRRLFNRKSG
ncbi:MAG: 50S ribosomal protein L22 [Candidatus Doudnabacteria bacterium]|nr:50S ribosomal protein L22 [Candidatus Doudnabacteria bacterium]